MQVGVCVLIVNDKGEVLAVSRKDNHSDFGLPGGKVEEGELPYQAAIRELYEETGIKGLWMHHVFEMQTPDCYCYCFTPSHWEGEIHTEEPHVVKWVPYKEILDGCFGLFNSALLANLLKEQFSLE